MFISDNNNNNINKFLINDIQIINNDKIIKELASELEQNTVKKGKLSSNKKEIEQKFKNACSNIEPIDLLGKKENNIKQLSNSNEKIKNNIIKNYEAISSKSIYNNGDEEQIIIYKINNNIPINNNQNQTISTHNHKDNIKNSNKEFNKDMNNINQNNTENRNINFNDNNNNYNYDNNIGQNNDYLFYIYTIINLNLIEINKNREIRITLILKFIKQDQQKKTDNKRDMITINNKNNNNEGNIPMVDDKNNVKSSNKILNNINKSVNDSINNFNPIRVNNEIHIN